MIRKKRKIKKLRGTRTCGGGNTKNRRGKGSKMGSGGWKKGQRNKLHYLKYKLKEDKGFVSRFKLGKKLRTINVGQLNEFEGEVDVTKLGYWKVLGGGELKKPLTIKAIKFTQKAIEKIEAAGGKAIVIGERIGA